MKFVVTIKDPDALFEATTGAAGKFLDSIEGLEELELDDNDKALLLEKKAIKLSKFAEQWVEWGEYYKIEFDTKEGTATLLKIKK